ncbi:unnamed protein product [Allacma fusca]|uniref:Tudor domain-containing protein n=1 Tax=Allacma fusca TaxID=39272 RepID=A0A8J2LN36_9HEXA|nr:unnamed protein product [Allacma fusca]
MGVRNQSTLSWQQTSIPCISIGGKWKTQEFLRAPMPFRRRMKEISKCEKTKPMKMDGFSPSDAMIYEFEMPQSIVGRLIGKFGNYVNKIKATTGANIIVKMHPTSGSLKICAVEGLCTEIDEALAMIRERFPANTFPYLSLEKTNQGKQTPPSSVSYLPSNNKLSLIEGVINDVMISNVITLDHIFVLQPTHPTYPALARMHKILSNVYEQPGIPHLVRPFNTGVICVTRVKDKDWVRAEVVAVQEDKDEVTARLVDIGGYIQVPIEDLRQIRVDFVSIPFQATECRLANLVPVDESLGWSDEALTYLKYLTMGQILQAHVVGYSPGDSTALIHLYRLNADQTCTLINEEMVSNEYARWVEETELLGLESGEEEWPSDTHGTEDYSSVEGNDHSSIEGNEYLLLRGTDELSVEGHDHSSVEGNDHSSIDGNERLFLEGMDHLSIECLDNASVGSNDRNSSHDEGHDHSSNDTNDALSTSSDGDP